MKVNELARRRRWLFHLSSVFVVSICVSIPCQAGVIVDIPASSNAESHHHSQQHSSLTSFLKGSYRPNEFLIKASQAIFTVSNLSESCSRDMGRFVAQLMYLFGGPEQGNNETTVENWTLQMLDAWGKPPEGILSGHINALGDFDECLAIRAPSKENPEMHQFQGKYCLMYLAPNISNVDVNSATSSSKVRQGERSIENLMRILAIVGNAELPLIPSIGSCLPSTCSDQEITEIVRAVFAGSSLYPVTSFCSVDEPQKLDSGAIATISVVAVLAVLVILGTLMELAINQQFVSQALSKTRTFAFFKAFSLITNGTKFLNTDTNENGVSCLHGIRFLSASWVVLGHTYLMGVIQPLWNVVETYSMITTSLSIVIIINAAIVVDVFFVIGGFLVSLTLLMMLEKSKGKMNVPLLYIHRYLRITPLYMTIVLIGTFVFPLLGSGPYWHVAKTWAGFCKKNWWKNALYINNLPIYDTLNDLSDAPCHGTAWYLGVDMQLFLLSPFLLFPVWKWKRNGWIPLALLTVASSLLPGVLTYINNYAATSVPFRPVGDSYSQKAYTPTYMRAGPYLVGMCTGIFFQSIRNKAFKLPRAIVLGAWLVAFCTGFAVLLSPRKFLNPEYDFQRGESAIFVSAQRTAWSLAISWLIFACGSGHGGWINQILSWKPFIPLSRLTFAIYLVSMHLQFIFHLQARQPIYFTNYHMVNLFFGHLVMSCLLALVCTMLIEAPFLQLLKLLLPTGSKTPGNNDTNNNSNSNTEPQSSKRCNASPGPSERSSSVCSRDELGSTMAIITP